MNSVGRMRLGGQATAGSTLGSTSMCSQGNPLSVYRASWLVTSAAREHVCRCVCLITALHLIHNSHGARRLVLLLLPVPRRSKFGQPCRLHARPQVKSAGLKEQFTQN